MLCFLLHAFRFLTDVIDCSDIEESRLRAIVHLTGQNRAESADCLGKRYERTGHAGKCLRHMEGLGQEPLRLTGAVHKCLILFRKFVHTENRDNVLQLVITLQHLLHLTGNRIMLLADDIGLQNPGTRCKRVNRRIDTLLYDLTGQNGRRVKM